MDQLYLIDDAAALLRVKPQTLRIWIMRRKIGSVKIGRKRLVPAAEIQKFIEKGFTPAIEQEVTTG